MRWQQMISIENIKKALSKFHDKLNVYYKFPLHGKYIAKSPFTADNEIMFHREQSTKSRRKKIKRHVRISNQTWPRFFVLQRKRKWVRNIFPEVMGAFHSTKNSGNFGWGSEWNKHFPPFHSEILGLPHEVGIKYRRMGITGRFRSRELRDNRIIKHLNIISVHYLTNNWNILLQHYCNGLASANISE